MVFVVEVIGWVVLILFSLKALHNAWNFLYVISLASFFPPNRDLRRYGPWAVVTGATDGLGEAFAYKLAEKGLNIMLVSRDYSKLQEVAYEIKRLHHTVQLRTIAVDFSEGQSVYPMLRFELANLSVGLLVNNVGMDVAFGPFAELRSEDAIEQIINCNIMSMARLTNILLPGMKKKQRGIVINIGSSLHGTGSTPYAAMYGATKAFIDKFSCDLAAECRSHGIIVQTVMPSILATKLSGYQDSPSLCIPTPDTYVDACLRTIGIETRTAAYWIHRILFYWREIFHFILPGPTTWLTVKVLRSFYEKREMCWKIEEPENRIFEQNVLE